MTRSRWFAVGLSLFTAALAAAFPYPPPPGPPLPEGAIRRFGSPDPPKKKADVPKGPPRMAARRVSESPAGAAIALTPDGRQLVVADRTGRIDLFDLGTGRRVRRFQETGPEGIHTIAVSPDGKWLACGRVRGDLELWDLTTGKSQGIFPEPARVDDDGRGVVERIAFGPDSKVLYTGVDLFSSSAHRGATAWAVPSGKRLWNVPSVGYNLAADPRGRWVLSSLLQEDPVRLGLLDAATGRVVRSMVLEPSWDGEEGGPVDASVTMDRLFTPDGSRLATLHSDGTVRVWDPEVGKEVVRMKYSQGRSGEPGGLAVSPDGRWLAVRDGPTVQLRELATGLKAHSITGLDGVPRGLAFTRDGRGLVTSAGPVPILWALKPARLPQTDGPADALWETLASDDAGAAYALIWALADDPPVAVSLLGTRIRPADLVVDRARFDKLLAALDSPEYAARERAERSLTAAGFTVPGVWLRQAVAASRSEEVRARLGRVVAARETPSPTRRRLDRAVQVLEMAGSVAATRLLKEWAAGPSGGYLTDVSAAAAGRLAGRP